MTERDQLAERIFKLGLGYCNAMIVVDFILNARPEKKEAPNIAYSTGKGHNTAIDLWTKNMLKGLGDGDHAR